MSQRREEMTNLPEAFVLESTLAERCAIRKDLRQTMGQAGRLARHSPETNAISTNPETASHMGEQVSWVPLTLLLPARGCVCAKLFQSCPVLRDPRDYSPPGSSVCGILQARTLEWAAISERGPLSPGDLPDPGIKIP